VKKNVIQLYSSFIPLRKLKTGHLRLFHDLAGSC